MPWWTQRRIDLFRYLFGSRMAVSRDSSIFKVWRTRCTVFRGGCAVPAPASSAGRSPLLHGLTSPCYLLSSLHWPFCRCEAMLRCGFDLHSPGDRWCWASFHAPVGHLYVIFIKFLFRSSVRFLLKNSYSSIAKRWRTSKHNIDGMLCERERGEPGYY